MASTGDGSLTHTRPEISTPALRVALNWDEVAGRWKQFTGKAQQRWGKLTDDDLAVATGRRDELIGKIQERYGISKDEANRQVDSWIKSLDP
uniref:CsbD family protein n=1 Tax=Rhodopseudomonas palustris (strain BisA53) TaxID=316055 RepID=Q07JQ5_RHOP5